MIVVLHSILFLCCCLSCLAADILQHPKLLFPSLEDNVTLTCEHNDSQQLMKFWYRQERGKSLTLIGHTSVTNDATMEAGFIDGRLTIKAVRVEKSQLTIRRISSQDDAIYYCASSRGHTNTAAYFGAGTILSVLENGKERKQPEVKVYRPNKKEFKEHNLISLVCVANGFYPEHVRLHWYMNGIKRDSIYPNVPQLNSDNKTYFTSKRLSLTRSEYFNPQNTFKCVTGFIDDESGKINDEIMGEADCSVSREQYGMSINQGKISYIMVMCKSGLYGIIVLFIIWRRKVIAASK